MKLGKLNAAIREHSGPISTYIELDRALKPAGERTRTYVGMVKGDLLAALKATFGDNRATETGLKIEDGKLAVDEPQEEPEA